MFRSAMKLTELINSVIFPILNWKAGVSVKEKKAGTIERKTKIVDKRFNREADLTQKVVKLSTIQPKP